MKTILQKSIYLFLLPLIAACTSPLEEVVVEDFNLIRANYNVIKTISDNGTVSDLVEVYISDKNYQRFKMIGATITVNGTEMAFNEGFLRDNYFAKMDVGLNTEYEFIITLANGQTATSTLTTPGTDFNSITYEKEFNMEEDYTISWAKGKDPVKIRFVMDDNDTEKQPYVFNRSMQTDNGQFVINREEKIRLPYPTTCYFELSYMGTAALSDKPRSTAYTVEVMYNARDIRIPTNESHL